MSRALPIINQHRRLDTAAAVVAGAIEPAEIAAAWASVTRWPGYAQTPLHDLKGHAGALGIARLSYKDEGSRFGLNSFKALGGGFAVQRYLQRQLGGAASLEGLLAGDFKERTRDLTVAAATDGNHGRAVAWGARTFGCRAVIYIHETVSQGRADAIAGYGAEIRRIPGVYEDALRRCAADAAENGWEVISDTAYPGCMTTPRTVMAGYTVMVAEALAQWGEAPPSHVFIQAGVGGLAASVTGCLHTRYGQDMPRVVVVEPTRADCCFQSARAGRWTPASGDLDTVCAGLACGEASLLAWDVLDAAAFAFMTVDDTEVISWMRRLGWPEHGDPAITAGESAPCGLAGLGSALADPKARALLGLDGDARVLVFGSEGATDPDLYNKLTKNSVLLMP